MPGDGPIIRGAIHITGTLHRGRGDGIIPPGAGDGTGDGHHLHGPGVGAIPVIIPAITPDGEVITAHLHRPPTVPARPATIMGRPAAVVEGMTMPLLVRRAVLATVRPHPDLRQELPTEAITAVLPRAATHISGQPALLVTVPPQATIPAPGITVTHGRPAHPTVTITMEISVPPNRPVTALTTITAITTPTGRATITATVLQADSQEEAGRAAIPAAEGRAAAVTAADECPSLPIKQPETKQPRSFTPRFIVGLKRPVNRNLS